ncbi:hypothetical protein B0H10DRAFT_2238506 [Mycena sp. CBHHK59/15]|nr:hypothetical protein B0H10DRAFT_2238506 [Mycena sp. CBHHK59/15]
MVLCATGKISSPTLIRYDQPVPIPSYLLTITSATGLSPNSSGGRGSGQPELIDAVYWEFSKDSTRFLAAGKKVFIPYTSGVYALLVLMFYGLFSVWNGDRTLVDMAVHELTHSWLGDGVIHADTSHCWPSEGWTVYTASSSKSYTTRLDQRRADSHAPSSSMSVADVKPRGTTVSGPVTLIRGSV